MIGGIPQGILELLKILETHGHFSYLVGGCVRDLLMDQTPKDWDICTPATPEELKEIFPSCIAMGEKYGTIGVKTQEGIVEITTFREEFEYQDFRHPRVGFVKELSKDLKRRDFTINAIAYHPQKGIVDDFDGVGDLKKRILRCVGDAKTRFQEDALRILRLVRFSCRFGFVPEQKTLQEALQHKHLLQQIAFERIAQELLLIIQGRYLHQFFKVYREIFALILPELSHPKQNRIENLSLLLAFLFDTQKALDRFMIKKEIKTRAQILIDYKAIKLEEDMIAIKMLLRTIGYDCFMALLELKKLMGINTKRIYQMLQAIMIGDECFCLKDLQIKGEDLKKMGFSGKKIGEVLEALLDDVIYERVCNTYEALHKRALYFSRM